MTTCSWSLGARIESVGAASLTFGSNDGFYWQSPKEVDRFNDNPRLFRALRRPRAPVGRACVSGRCVMGNRAAFMRS